jgi:peptidoglycan-associated lipoprotein
MLSTHEFVAFALTAVLAQGCYQKSRLALTPVRSQVYSERDAERLREELARAPAGEPVGQATLTSATSARAPEAPVPIAVPRDVLDACHMPLDDVDRAPKFDTDRIVLKNADRQMLASLGRCLSTGPLAFRDIEIIGHADPRGDDDYNYGLGAMRAGTVAAQLEANGVHTSRIRVISRGSTEAQGTDEATWAFDRRVDIVLR